MSAYIIQSLVLEAQFIWLVENSQSFPLISDYPANSGIGVDARRGNERGNGMRMAKWKADENEPLGMRFNGDLFLCSTGRAKRAPAQPGPLRGYGSSP
jgi:hypothetical protein